MRSLNWTAQRAKRPYWEHVFLKYTLNGNYGSLEKIENTDIGNDCEHYGGPLGVAHLHVYCNKHVSLHSDIWPLPQLADEAAVQCSIILISEGWVGAEPEHAIMPLLTQHCNLKIIFGNHQFRNDKLFWKRNFGNHQLETRNLEIASLEWPFSATVIT